MPDETRRPDPSNPTSWLPGYRVVVFNAPGLGFHVAELDAGNDEHALMLARAVADGSPFELWDALVMVGRYTSAY